MLGVNWVSFACFCSGFCLVVSFLFLLLGGGWGFLWFWGGFVWLVWF